MRYRVFEVKTPNGWQATEVILEDVDGVVCGWAMRRQEYVSLPAERIEDVTAEMLRRPSGTELRGSEVLSALDGTDPWELLGPMPQSKLASIR